MQNLKEYFEQLSQELCTGLVGKENSMKLGLLAIASKESIFLLGLPGTAKSLLARRLSMGLENVDVTNPSNKGKVSYFETLLGSFSEPNQIFGPVSINALKNDEYKVITDRFLPSAYYAFIDEIWKANSAIQNSLLTILNERIFQNGAVVEKVPLISFIAASNELPQKDAGLDAIFDRFIIRIIEKPITTDSDFLAVILSAKNPEINISKKISINEIEKWNEEAEFVSVPDECLEIILKIRKTLEVKNMEEDREGNEVYKVSPRRWKKIVGLLKMVAYINGRDSVTLSDFVIVPYCLWSTELQEQESFKIVSDILMESIDVTTVDATVLNNELDNTKGRIDSIIEKSHNSAKPNKVDSFNKIIDCISPLMAKITSAIEPVEEKCQKNISLFSENFFKNDVILSELKAKQSSALADLNKLLGKTSELLFSKTEKLLSDFIYLDRQVAELSGSVNRLQEDVKNTIHTIKSVPSKEDYERLQQSLIQTIQSNKIKPLLTSITEERNTFNEVLESCSSVLGERNLLNPEISDKFNKLKCNLEALMDNYSKQTSELKQQLDEYSQKNINSVM